MVARSLVAASVVVVAACGGRSGTAAPVIGNAPRPRPVEGWSVARVVDTLPPRTDALVVVDGGKLRASKLLGSRWPAVADSLPPASCRRLFDVDATIVLAIPRLDRSPAATRVWLLGVPVRELADCFAGLGSPVHVVDDKSVVIQLGEPASDAELAALVRETGGPTTIPQLGRLVGSGTAIWLHVDGDNTRVRSGVATPFTAISATIDVADRLVADARIVMPSIDEANQTTDTVQSQLDQFAQFGLLAADDIVTITPDDATIIFHASLAQETVDRWWGFVGPSILGLLPSLVPPTTPAPPPTMP